MTQKERDAFILSNLGLVRTIAKGFMGMGLDFDDLMQEGCVGLIRATDKYDPSRKCKFSSMAGPWIRGAIKDALNREELFTTPPRVLNARRKEKND